jgi:hypothetical protein
MIGRISLVTISLLIGACASSGPEASAPVVSDTSAGADAVVSDTPSGAPAGVIDDPDAPTVEVSASAAASSDPDEIICRRETPTGSRMSRRVCRTRAEIEARAERDQETLEQSRATQSGGSCALNQSC